jgi:hypothetical protein
LSQARRQVAASRVRRELLPDQSPELLKALHLLTRDGRLNADALRKLKQVNHLVGLLTPALDDVLARFGQPQVVDVGSGNAYLGFVLYELFLKEKGELTCVESKSQLSSQASERSKGLGFSRMKFETAEIAAAGYPERIHLLTALHACDTATDDAIVVALTHNADHIALVPCCQAELAQQLKGRESAMAVLYEHPMHRREFGSHLTNVIRALLLEAHGYQVTVTELTGWEHSLKNELILGKRIRGENRDARARLDKLLADTGVRPKVIRALAAAEPPPCA